MYRIGVDIGGTKINIGLFSDDGTLIINKKILICDIKDIAVSVCDTINELVSESNISFNEITSCGIGIPGTVSADGKHIIKAPNIAILHSNIAEEIEEKLDIPVSLVQDSRAAAWGEYLFGAGKGAKIVVCITLGTGIGCGIVMNGEILHGSLGSAGELGHLPAVANGRPCGCGKRGCVEKYAAGGGLDITAKEMLGADKTAADLFVEASAGNENAKNALNDAIHMLGNAIVSVINILSPDCILFSGGLSKQESLYVNPLINYIKSHCYSAGKIPNMTLAALSENSPLTGAAFIPVKNRRKPILSASVMCADLLNMAKDLKEIEAAGIDYLHCDIMDNHFVPNLMLPMEMLNKLRAGTNLPFDYHIMAENPDSIIEKLDIRKHDIVSVHYESTNHLQRAISLIKEKGADACVAVNPATPIEVLSEILPQLDFVLLMTVNPGFSGQKMTCGSIEKISRLKEMLNRKGNRNILIEVDGNCSFENAPKMYSAGADILVVGTSSVFQKEISIENGTKKLLAILKGDCENA